MWRCGCRCALQLQGCKESLCLLLLVALDCPCGLKAGLSLRSWRARHCDMPPANTCWTAVTTVAAGLSPSTVRQHLCRMKRSSHYSPAISHCSGSQRSTAALRRSRTWYTSDWPACSLSAGAPSGRRRLHRRHLHRTQGWTPSWAGWTRQRWSRHKQHARHALGEAMDWPHVMP